MRFMGTVIVLASAMTLSGCGGSDELSTVGEGSSRRTSTTLEASASTEAEDTALPESTVVPLPDSNVDRVATRNNIVAQLADAGVDIDPDCVDVEMAKFTDAELSAIDAVLLNGGSNSQSDALIGALMTCVDTAGG